jgi:hypothetical protein
MVMSMQHIFLSSFATVGIVACGSLDLDSKSAPSKVINENSLVAVERDASNIPEKFKPILGAVGRMSMGCTATHIGNGIAVTAGHCFSGVATTFEQNNLPCDEVSVEWGVLKDSQPVLTSQCKKILSIQVSDDFDYAFLKVDVAPKAVVSVNTFGWPAVGTRITVLGYPQKRTLEWSQSCELQSRFKGKFGSMMFSHQCDTEYGNSGGPVLEESSLELVGIHNGGVVPWNSATFLKATPIQQILKQKP